MSGISRMLMASMFATSALAQAAYDPLAIGRDEIFGADPQLPAPQSQWIPTIKIAEPVGWRDGEKPVAPDQFVVTEFASGLDHPRWLHVLPDGSVLVAESNAPPDETFSFTSWVMSLFMSKAGAGGPSANRITRLADADGDGIAETKSVFLGNLFSPFGMAVAGSTLYVANADAIVAHTLDLSRMSVDPNGRKVVALPGGPRNHHWTKNIVLSSDLAKLYAAVGSNSNAGENGMDEEEGRAAIWEVPLDGKPARIFAGGLRNPVGMDLEPQTGVLWTVVNERDALGDNLVPDYLTRVTDGAFYGWPYLYFGTHPDRRAPTPVGGAVPETTAPDYALGAHTASLGLAFSDGNTLGPAYASGAFIGQHGSWNRAEPAGYRVVFVPFAGGKPAGKPSVVLGGFLTADGKARGRPVGVVRDGRGGLLVADDVGNKIWRVSLR